MLLGNINSRMKLIGALDQAGAEMIDEGAVSKAAGCGGRLKSRPNATTADIGGRSVLRSSRAARAHK